MSRTATDELTFVTSKDWGKRRTSMAYRVMLFEPRGIYPRGTQFVPNGFFHADERVAFSVVRGESWRMIDPETPYSEFDWASPQELRLMAAMLFCEKREELYLRFYPLVRCENLLDVSTLDLANAETVTLVRDLIIKRAKDSSGDWTTNRFHSCLSKPYEVAEPSRYQLFRLTEFWNALSAPNYILLRGTYALIKADMLSCHYEFFEEAIISLYISLEASFTLISRRLKEEGTTNPTAHDAAMWLHSHFDSPFGLPQPGATEKYFQEFYEQRIMTLHPASRFGDLPYAPIMHDDFSHLRRSLREILGYLALGKHGPDFVNDAAKHVG